MSFNSTPACDKVPVIISRVGLFHILMIGGECRHGIFLHDQSLQLLHNIRIVIQTQWPPLKWILLDIE